MIIRVDFRANGTQVGTTTTNGIWSGIDAVTGELLWQTVPTFGGSPFGGASSCGVTISSPAIFASMIFRSSS